MMQSVCCDRGDVTRQGSPSKEDVRGEASPLFSNPRPVEGDEKSFPPFDTAEQEITSNVQCLIL